MNDRGMVRSSISPANVKSIYHSNRFYESLKLKTWMCELYTFLQIWSQLLLLIIQIIINATFYEKWMSRKFCCINNY